MKLLQHLNQLSLHPKNAAELKGLILQLAVQGKLTAQWRLENPNVEPASELLKRVESERTKLVEEKKIRKENPLPPVNEIEKDYQLPDLWSWCRLGNIGQCQTGTTPSKSHSEYYGDYIPFVGPAHISNDNMTYPDEGLSEIGLGKGRLIKAGSLMMVCIGGSIGKCNVNEIDVTCNQQINTLTPYFTQIGYVKILAQTPYFQRTIHERATGSATPLINKGKWELIPVQLPPLEEQKAIVTTVEQLFTEVEQLETLTKERIQLKEDFVTSALQRLTNNDTQSEWAFLAPHFRTFFTEQTNVAKLREAILQLAVQGKLTRSFRARHPELVEGSHSAKALLERIQAEKVKLVKEKKIKKEKPLPPISEDEIPYKLPEGWVWCRLSELTELITKGSSPKWQGVQYVDKEGGLLFITSENVGSYKLLLHKKKYVELKFNEIEPRSILKRNDLLMNIVGASIGRTAIYDIDELANINQAVTIIRLLPFVSYGYFLDFFNSPVCISYMYDKQVDNARPNLSMGNISKFLIPFPSLEEQNAIVTIVEQLFELCDKLEQSIQTSKTTQEQWMQSCLKEVFEEREEVEI